MHIQLVLCQFYSKSTDYLLQALTNVPLTITSHLHNASERTSNLHPKSTQLTRNHQIEVPGTNKCVRIEDRIILSLDQNLDHDCVNHIRLSKLSTNTAGTFFEAQHCNFIKHIRPTIAQHHYRNLQTTDQKDLLAPRIQTNKKYGEKRKKETTVTKTVAQRIKRATANIQ